MSDVLPPWKAKSREDVEWMENWVNQKLDEWHKENGLDQSWFVAELEKGVKAEKWRATEEYALIAAETGDIEPLKALYPHLAKYLRKSERSAGNHLRPPPGGGRAEKAARDVPRIRGIWLMFYGRTNRTVREGSVSKLGASISLGLTAVEIAARRHKVAASSVEKALKLVSKYKPKKGASKKP